MIVLFSMFFPRIYIPHVKKFCVRYFIGDVLKIEKMKISNDYLACSRLFNKRIKGFECATDCH